ncbi:hypothetical protein BGZ58_007850 [Dissophora ornata]|nr:hypothetical protein BGZ58_007850 [Dissophora ornata]
MYLLEQAGTFVIPTTIAMIPALLTTLLTLFSTKEDLKHILDGEAGIRKRSPLSPNWHPAPVGPIGTTAVPTYTQSIPLTAAGVVPTAYAAENQGTHYHHLGKEAVGLASGAITTARRSASTSSNHHHFCHGPGNSNEAAGLTFGGVPVNTTNVPAMGAPGTTTAASTHTPGQYNAANPVATAGQQNIPGAYNTDAGVNLSVNINRPVA